MLPNYDKEKPKLHPPVPTPTPSNPHSAWALKPRNPKPEAPVSKDQPPGSHYLDIENPYLFRD